MQCKPQCMFTFVGVLLFGMGGGGSVLQKEGMGA